jgi:hypothetical protein
MFHYGYFVICKNGRLAPAGDDWGMALDNYKPGDDFGTKNGVKAIVIDVIKGQEAALNNVDIMILLEEQRTRTIPTLEWIKHVMTRLASARPRRMTSRPQIQVDFHGQKLRAVRNKMYARPLNETLQDFLINHLLWLLGEDWFNSEMAKMPEQRHIILRWRHELIQQLQKHDSPNRDKSLPLKTPMTGGTKALLVLADDAYQLAQALDTPTKVIERLGNMNEFQGARYEILVASLFARCGFQIGFIDDSSKRNPEFIAIKATEKIAVEAKSRHRAGVLHERGEFTDDAPAEIKRLYESALGQNSGTMPFVVFLDVNLPLTPQVRINEKVWVKEAMQAFHDRRQEERVDSDTALILTNFGWYYSRDPQLPRGEYMVGRHEKPEYEIADETWKLLERVLSEYGLIIDEEQYAQRVSS